MFEFYGYFLTVTYTETGLLVCLHQDRQDDDPIEYLCATRDPYNAAALLATDLDLYTESEIIQLGQLIDGHV